MNDIRDIEDIKLLVNTFYDKIRQDDMLGPIFNGRIAPDAWPAHLETMYKFWGTQLLGEKDYFGAPYVKHRTLPVDQVHFDRWVQLWHATADSLFQGPRIATAKVKGASIAEIFLSKIRFERGMFGQ